jgi:D-alanyl-D-alanine-carboxypeptidase/D-alanyl-D-alanine-endopeptidase
LKQGDKALAIENYKKSLDLNPQNDNARDVLKKLDVSSR